MSTGLTPSAPVILEWRELKRNTLRGFAKVRFASGMIVSDITVHVGPNGGWASPPGRPQVGRDGQVIKDQNGKAAYTTLIDFADRGTRPRWSQSVVDALSLAHPDALS